jgi:hypothetical protein
MSGIGAVYEHFIRLQLTVVFTDSTFRTFSIVPALVRVATAEQQTQTPYRYENEPFFPVYDALFRIWKKRESQRKVAAEFGLGRDTLRGWEDAFLRHGAIGFLRIPGLVEVDPRLERLVLLVRQARPKTGSAHISTLAQALGIPGADMDVIRRIQRSHGYGQRQDETDRAFYAGLQKILVSVVHHQRSSGKQKRVLEQRAETFFDFDRDPFQHKVELFKELSTAPSRQVRPLLQRYGIHSSRFYELRKRYLQYGVWGLVDLVHTPRRKAEKISAELELKIIEERLAHPELSTRKMIKTLKLRCSQANVQKIYARWGLARIKQSVPIRGVISEPVPDPLPAKGFAKRLSARARFPNLIEEANLKVHGSFIRFVKTLSYRSVPISNPGAIVIAPFLEQLGIVEALHTHGPPALRTTDISNDILLNVFRIVAGFPTIHSYLLNSDRSIAIAAGRLQHPGRSTFYLNLDEFRFEHLQKLRNDLALRAKELNLIEGKEIAIDYHCDPSDSRYPRDKGQSKSPDKKGDVVYAHRPHLLWDSGTNTILNIAYCEGRSRAPSALYRFLEDNLFQIIDSEAIQEIYADSEYTGERQLVYLLVRSNMDVTMCLKQNRKIRKWKEETLAQADWRPYGKEYRIASRDFRLPETNKAFRFVVKQNTETNETRCFGSTHTELSATKILDRYHIRWPVETGIKDLVENYFLNKPTGDSPEKVEVHYYCVMIARLLIDYFRGVLNEPRWRMPEGWESVLSTIRTSEFSNQNCELTLDDTGDLLLTYLDGDPTGVKANMRDMLERRREAGLNRVSWWGGRGVRIRIEDRYGFVNGPEND